MCKQKHLSRHVLWTKNLRCDLCPAQSLVSNSLFYSNTCELVYACSYSVFDLSAYLERVVLNISHNKAPTKITWNEKWKSNFHCVSVEPILARIPGLPCLMQCEVQMQMLIQEHAWQQKFLYYYHNCNYILYKYLSTNISCFHNTFCLFLVALYAVTVTCSRNTYVVVYSVHNNSTGVIIVLITTWWNMKLVWMKCFIN